MNNYNFETDTITYKDHKIENFFKDFPQQNYIKNYVRDNLICLYVGGSHAYGLDTETSDLDIRGIFKDSIDQVLGYQKVEQLENSTNDIVIYCLSKIIHLIAEGNPNCQEALHIDEEEILFATDDYWYLRSQRNSLLSKIVKHKYSGYAISQLKRIKGHDKWLVKEREGRFNKKPNIKDYIIYINKKGIVKKGSNLIQKRESYIDKILNDIFGQYTINSDHFYYTKIKDELYNVWYHGMKSYPLIEDGNSFVPIQEYSNMRHLYIGIIWFNKSQFQTDLDEYNNWKKWKENRNEKRHELEKDFGFDTKHACHTFRLLNMGLEILNGEGVKVKRPDREFLMDIRNGKYKYEWIIKEAERLDKEVLETAYKNSKLQNSVDKKYVINIIKHILKLK